MTATVKTLERDATNNLLVKGLALASEVQGRHLEFVTDFIMGINSNPVDVCSAPEPDLVYTLHDDADGMIIETSIDLSCVVASVQASTAGERVITINNVVRDCELTGCDGTSINENKKIALTHSDQNAEDVLIFLTNNGAPVTTDSLGNSLPEYYVMSYGQLKFLSIVNGKIDGILA